MNAPTNIRPRQLAQYAYTCWRLIGPAQPHPIQARTLQEVEAALATEANHGNTFLVLETDVIRETASLHVYRVRRANGRAGMTARARLIRIAPITCSRCP